MRVFVRGDSGYEIFENELLPLKRERGIFDSNWC
jgi:hypothetical protein